MAAAGPAGGTAGVAGVVGVVGVGVALGGMMERTDLNSDTSIATGDESWLDVMTMEWS